MASGTSTTQDAVLVAGARLLGDHVGAQLDGPPERPVLDLDLLVEPALGLLGAALAGDQQLAPADLERHVVDVHAGEVGLDDRARRVVRVEDVDATARSPRPRNPVRSNTSPNSSSISRRIRSKLAKRSRSGVTRQAYPGDARGTQRS